MPQAYGRMANAVMGDFCTWCLEVAREFYAMAAGDIVQRSGDPAAPRR